MEDAAGIAADLAFFGAPEEMTAGFEARAAETIFGIFHENADAFTLFDALGSQWRTVGLGGMAGGVMRTGLDYTSIPAIALMMGIETGADIFKRLRLLEAGAMEAWGEAMERQMKRARR